MREGSPLSEILRSKWLWGFLIVDLVVIVVLVVLEVNTKLADATLVLNVVPRNATVAINNKGGYEVGTYKLRPGTYNVAIAHDELDTKTFTVNLESDHTTAITTFLTKDGGIEFYKQRQNHSDFYDLAEIAAFGKNTTTDHDTSAEGVIGKWQSNYEALSNLPVYDAEYEIVEGEGQRLVWDVTVRTSYDQSCETWLCVEALMYGTDDQNLIAEMLAEKGLQAEDYEIKYKVY